VRPRVGVVRDVGCHDCSETCRVEHDHVIEALAAERADEPLDVGVLPRCAWRRADDLDTHGRRRPRHCLKGEISVVNDVARCLIPRKRFAQLLCGPGRGWMFRHADIKDAPTFVREDDEHEEEATRRRRNSQEIGSYDLPDVIGQERAPRLRGRCGRARGTSRRLPERFPRRASKARRGSVAHPHRIVVRHLPNQRAHICGHRRSTGAPTTLPRPKQAKAFAMPGDDVSASR